MKGAAIEMWLAGPSKFSINLPLVFQHSSAAQGYLTSNETDSILDFILALEEEEVVISLQVSHTSLTGFSGIRNAGQIVSNRQIN